MSSPTQAERKGWLQNAQLTVFPVYFSPCSQLARLYVAKVTTCFILSPKLLLCFITAILWYAMAPEEGEDTETFCPPLYFQMLQQ